MGTSPKETEISTIGVVGAGTMGSGIAQLCVQNDFEVQLYDLGERILANAEDRILKGLHRVEKPSAFSLLRKTTNLERLAGCDFIIEAASEDFPVKQDIFRKLDALIEPPKVLATNTSSLSITAIASATENPDRVAGMHFFNPAPILRLVEIIRAQQTSDQTVQIVLDLAKHLEKTPVCCKDTPGFIANRVTRPFYLVGMRLLEDGRGTPAEIDHAVRQAGGFRMGPFELMDLIGLDVNHAISKIVYESLDCPEALKPCGIQDRLIEKGSLGRKNGQGFYLYGDHPPGTINPLIYEFIPSLREKRGNHKNPQQIFKEILLAVIEEAKNALQEEVASREDIDTAMRLGMNWPKGPFEWEREIGQ